MNRALLLLLSVLTIPVAAAEREQVELPPMMREHLLANMRDHLESINGILEHLAAGRMDQAADLAEQRLGMSSLDAHGAAHMAPYMPERMQALGTDMHHAASRFARVAQEGDPLPAYRALAAVTGACVACHGAFRVH
ncbi:MAG: hypothetical protein PHF72_13980 [Gammaproteobacteria bacterium]|nr:hypothetical protein [Gammaproteobacteria bacterium]